MLTGRPAFHGADYKQILEKNKKGEPAYPKRFWNRISEAGENLVKSMIEKDPEKRLSAVECLQHEWFAVERTDSGVLDDAMEGFKEFQDYEAPCNKDDASNPLLTVTPVMAGRKLKDTCESPWNPSGTTPKMQPTTPLLRHGFEQQPRQMKLPGVSPIGVMPKPREEKPTTQISTAEMDNFKKFEMIQQQRKAKKPQGTVNFGQIEAKLRKSGEKQEDK